MQKKRIFKILKWFFGTILSLFLLISLLLYIFKDEICQVAIDEVNKHLNTKVTVSEVDLTFWSTFPNLSIDFNHVYIQDARPNATERDTLLYTDKIRCKINPFDVWKEEYKVKSLEVFPGVLNLRVDEDGDNNYGIFKEPEESGEESVDFELKEVLFKDFRFNYINNATSQIYKTHLKNLNLEGELSKDVFTTTAESKMKIIAAQSGNITLVSYKPARLGVKVKVDTKNGTVEIPKSTIHVANLPFDFEAKMDTSGFNFEMSGKDIGIDDAANNLAIKETKSIKDFSGRGKFLFDLKVAGKNEATSPVEITCNFGVEKGVLRDPNSGISMKDLSLEGMYSNIGGPDKEFVELKNIGFISNGGPFRANLKITQFEKPLYKGDAVGLLNLSVVRSLFKLTSFKQLKGTVDLSSRFAVETVVNEDESTSFNIKKCEGEVFFNKVKAQLQEDKRVYKDIEGKVYLRNDRVGMEGVTLKVGSSDFALDGVFNQVVDYFSRRGSLVVDVHMKSSRIDLEDLGSDSKEEIMHQARAFILPNDIEGKIYLDVNKLKYDKHYFHNLKGNMSLLNRKIHFPKLTVRNGGADTNGSLTIIEDKPEIFNISCQVVSNNIEFSKLFKEWDNFEQSVIKSNNISGTARANIRFEAPFDLRSGIIMKAIDAQVGIKVDNGRLKDVYTFKEITKSLNEMASARIAIGKENIKMFEQKLLDLRFDHLENTLIIRDGVIVIPSMSVHSSALDVELSGKHSFDNMIDYRFGFRFQDLKQKKESEFGEIVDDGTGKHVFMRMYGSLYNPSYEWDAEANKAHKKEQREIAKQDAKAIFKSEFGLFKNDTTVQEYVQERRPHEKLEIIINPTEENEDIIEQTTPKPDGKWKKWLKEEGAKIKKEKEGSTEIDWEYD